MLLHDRCLSLGMDWWNTTYPKVVAEFLEEEDCLLPDSQQLKHCQGIGRPDVPACLSILVRKLAWTEEYAVQKMIPLVALWQARSDADREEEEEAQGDTLLCPLRIVKRRTCGGVASLQVEWETARVEVADEMAAGEALELPGAFEAVVPADVVERAYPEMFAQFMESLKKPKKKSVAARKKKPKETDERPAATQGQITDFFTQRRKSLSGRDRSPEGSRLKKEEVEVGDEEPEDDDDNGDNSKELSLLVDQILGGRKRENCQTSARRDLPHSSSSSSWPFITSTPESARSGTRVRQGPEEQPREAGKIKSVFQHKATESAGDLEDSFDRMCL